MLAFRGDEDVLIYVSVRQVTTGARHMAPDLISRLGNWCVSTHH